MSKLREYIESNTIRRLTEEQQDMLALMVDAGDDRGLSEWCAENDVSMDLVKRWARTGVLAAGLALGSSEPILAEDTVPDWIRDRANQTAFAQAARHAVPESDTPTASAPDRSHWNSRPGMLWDPVENIWVRRSSAYVQFDPYQAARQMHGRMAGTGISEDFAMPKTGGPGVVPPDPPPPPGATVDIDSSPEGDPGEPVDSPPEDVQSQTIMYDFGGQKVAFKPFPTPIEIARARQMGAFTTQVRLKNQPNLSNALVYEQNGIKYVLLLPRN